MTETHRMMSPDEYIRSLERTHPDPANKDHKPLTRRIVKWLLILLAVLLVGAVSYLVWLMTKVSNNPFDFSGLSADGSGRTNVLIMGDGDPGHAGDNLTDTMQVLSLVPDKKAIAQIGLPRDMRVSIPGYYKAKINTANALGGPHLAQQTVSDTLNLPMHYYMLMDFSGFRDVVNAVGGVDVNVKEELIDPEYPCDDNQYKVCGVDIKPGPQHMDGATALKYVRCRKGTCGNDFGRAARQQEVMDQVVHKVANPWIVVKPWVVIGLAQAFQKNVKTDMGMNQLIQMAWDYKHAATRIQFVFNNQPGGFLTGYSGTSDLLPPRGDYTDIQTFVNDIFTNPPKTPTQAQ